MDRPQGIGHPRLDGRTVPGEVRARATVRGVVRLQILANSLGRRRGGRLLQVPLPRAGDRRSSADLDLNVVVFGAYLAVMILLALPLNALVLRRAVVWVREGDSHRPTASGKLLFSLPLVETLSALLSWLGAAVLFGIINEDVQRVSVGIAARRRRHLHAALPAARGALPAASTRWRWSTPTCPRTAATCCPG